MVWKLELFVVVNRLMNRFNKIITCLYCDGLRLGDKLIGVHLLSIISFLHNEFITNFGVWIIRRIQCINHTVWLILFELVFVFYIAGLVIWLNWPALIYLEYIILITIWHFTNGYIVTFYFRFAIDCVIKIDIYFGIV